MSTPTPISDRLEQAVGAERHASSPSRDGKGGEWNAWYALARRQRRKLIGAGWARKGATAPDILADIIAREMGLTDYREALEWYYRNALAAIPERRLAAVNDSRAKLARNHGAASYYHLRNQRARDAGYASLWAMRKAKGWSSERPAKWKPTLNINNTDNHKENTQCQHHRNSSGNSSSGMPSPRPRQLNGHGSTEASSLKTTSRTTPGSPRSNSSSTRSSAPHPASSAAPTTPAPASTRGISTSTAMTSPGQRSASARIT